MSFKVIGGDIPESTAFSEHWSKCYLVIVKGFLKADKYLLNGNVASVEIVTEENQKKFVGAAGWGLVGGLALGPLGLLAGVLAGGNKKEVCFACVLADGRKFIAKSDTKTYQKFVTFVMANPPAAVQELAASSIENDDDIISKLERLAKLKEQGILTEQEFAEQKAILLSK
ncbi:SHOCT domain-containing protein [Sporomusa sphaeroides DSM 2875]|uniref:SHOCT domain-containing protein n=1 Tax=Sporomusa sphaeroides TaxID=47679 RepID=UPI00202DC6DD|nr:SHOCT domain-containing protein [Sporomusa sphaeroides]MCM0757404.1 SHOCT domain-containing protein [Sporomusa sphaeroides DSM 2875]